MIAGMIGRAGAGKDFTHDYLRRNSKRQVIRVAFADQLKYEIEDELNDGVPMPVLWAKPYPESVRRMLQWWGTDYRRATDPDYWLNKGAQFMVNVQRENPGALVVVTDVRFPNEANLIRDELGGIIIRVWASEATRVRRLGALPPEHESETALEDYYAAITLDASVDGNLVPTDGSGYWAGLLHSLGFPEPHGWAGDR